MKFLFHFAANPLPRVRAASGRSQTADWVALPENWAFRRRNYFALLRRNKARDVRLSRGGSEIVSVEIDGKSSVVAANAKWRSAYLENFDQLMIVQFGGCLRNEIPCRRKSRENCTLMHEWESETRYSMRSTVVGCFPNFLKRFPCSKRSIISLASITKQWKVIPR